MIDIDWNFVFSTVPFLIAAVGGFLKLKLDIQRLQSRQDATDSQILDIKKDMASTTIELKSLHDTMGQILVTLGRIEERLSFVIERDK